jgi:hypothetical protein
MSILKISGVFETVKKILGGNILPFLEHLFNQLAILAGYLALRLALFSKIILCLYNILH